MDGGFVVGNVTLALTLAIYLIGRKKKSLSYEVLSESPLISISDEIKNNLQVLFNGEPVENIHLLLVKVVNTGNTPIATSDYERPLSLRFTGASNIISAENTEVAPNNLSPSININGQAVIVEPLMLNSGDSFTIKILVRQYSSKFDVDARVLGVKSIRMLSKNDRGVRVILTSLVTEIALPVTIVAVGVALFSFVAGRVNEHLLPPQLNIHAIEMDRYILRERETAKLMPVISSPTLVRSSPVRSALLRSGVRYIFPCLRQLFHTSTPCFKISRCSGLAIAVSSGER